MRIWERKGYEIVEKEFDFDLHQFEVIQMGESIATITPETIEDMNQIIEDLENGEDVNGWEDGQGNTISIKELNGILVSNNAYDAVLLTNGSYMFVNEEILIDYLTKPDLDNWQGCEKWEGESLEALANSFGKVIAYYLDDELIVVNEELLSERKLFHLGE